MCELLQDRLQKSGVLLLELPQCVELGVLSQEIEGASGGGCSTLRSSS